MSSIDRFPLIEAGPFAGWRIWAGADEPFERQVGPFYFRETESGLVETAADVEPRHLNGGGVAHGGFVMTLVDYALFAIAWRSLTDTRAVTVSCDTQFLAPGKLGGRLIASGALLRETGSMLFVQGRVTQAGEAVAAFSGVLKKIKPRA